MANLWYPAALLIDGETVYFLWMGDDWAKDLVLVSDDRVVLFPDVKSAREFATHQRLPFAPEEPGRPFDFDAAAAWLSDGGTPDAEILLNIWNLAGDVARSVEKPFEDRSGELDAIYNKIFAGNNLPAMTPPGEHYEPEWDLEELALLRRIIGQGVDLIRSAVSPRN
jgi:hypothetical protein